MQKHENMQALLVSYLVFLEQLQVSQTTGWRWRKRGMLKVININGRLYISQEEIAKFTRRAAAGEFAKQPVMPLQKGEPE